MSGDSITFFPVGNGDTVLIQIADRTILTDCNYRQAAQDTNNTDAYDIRPHLLQACLQSDSRYHLNLFVLTHPDADHLRGFSTLFYCGDPDNYQNRGDEREQQILVDEMWISAYSANPNYETDDSEPVFTEIRRRISLQGKNGAQKSGNRIRILQVGSNDKGDLFDDNRISWRLLAPTADEATVPDSSKSENHLSSNDTSLVLHWTLRNGQTTTRLLLGGDATVDVWDRIAADASLRKLTHSIVLAPHHCSRGAIARKQEDETYLYSENAISFLGNFDGDGFFVASSKQIKKNDDNPPSWDARQKYLNRLKSIQPLYHEERFANPDTFNRGNPEPVIFEIRASGVVLKPPGTATAKAAPSNTTPYSRPTYG